MTGVMIDTNVVVSAHLNTVDPDRVNETLHALRERAALIEPRHTLSASADEPDNRFLECGDFQRALPCHRQ